MNSLMNSINYSSCGQENSIDPAMHIINSLGPKKVSMVGSSSTAVFSSTHPTTAASHIATDNNYTSHGYQSPLDFLESLRYNTAYSPKTYQPTSSLSIGSSFGKTGYNGIDPVGYGTMHSYSQHNQSANKSGEFNPDENNNFMRDQRGRFAQCGDRVSDGDPTDRIRQLAQPKRVPCEYQDDRSVYWMSKRMKPNCGNHTHFETTPRLDELAMPKAVKDEGDCCRPSSCDQHWCYQPQRPCPERGPNSIDWSRLAAPKTRYPQNYRPLQHVRKSALKARCTKRVQLLATPLPRKTTKMFTKEEQEI